MTPNTGNPKKNSSYNVAAKNKTSPRMPGISI